MAVVFCTLVLAPLSSAQLGGNFEFGEDVSIEIGVSALGIQLSPETRISDKARVRGLFSFGDLSADETVDGNSFSASISTQSFGAMLDYYPTGDNFRVSAGLISGGYEMTGSVDELTFDDTTYEEEFSLTLQERDTIAPVLGIGFANKSSRVAVFVEGGLRFNTFELTTTGQNALSEADRATYEADLAEVNDDLEDAGFLPFFALGASVSF